MRIDHVKGLYLTYRDTGQPVEVFDRIPYAFKAPSRTCLIQDPRHIILLLRTDRYTVTGVEVASDRVAETTSTATRDTSSTMETKPRKGKVHG